MQVAGMEALGLVLYIDYGTDILQYFLISLQIFQTRTTSPKVKKKKKNQNSGRLLLISASP